MLRTTRIWMLAFAITAAVSCEIPSRADLPTGETATRLAVSPKNLIMQQYQVADFTAIGFTSSGDTADVAINWSVSTGTITDTSTSGGRHRGRYKPGADTGRVKIVAKGNQGGPADTAVVVVTEAPVTTVVMSPAAASIAIGSTVQLSAAPQDLDGNPLPGRVVTWASTNPGVATVSSGGLVRGVAAGAATMTASCEGQTGAVAITVTVVPVATVAVTPASASVTIGQTVQLTATPKDANGNPLSGRTVTWATSNAAVATVSGTGLVSGVAVGSATLTATSEGKSGTATVTVSAVPVASVTVTPASASVVAGQTVQLTASPKDASGNALTGRVVTWATSNAAVATVNGSGLVTSVAVGSATITATSEGQRGTSTITVTAPAPAPVASVDVIPGAASVAIGLTVQLSATPKDSAGYELTGRTVTWASSNTSVATVSTSGLVTGKVAGTATITATSEGQSGTAAITVTSIPVASVSVSPTSANLQVNQTVQLTATPKDASGAPLMGRTVTWASSNTGVATVNASGLVTAKLVGTATITATSEGQNGTSAITVAASTAPVASVTVSPASTDVFIGGVAQLTATPKDASGLPLTGRIVTWASSNTGIAAVSPTGLVTGVAQGLATITATSEGKNGTSAITVNPLPTGQCGTWPAGIANWVAPLPLSNGQAFYAAPSGSDGNPGTLAAPWRSLAKASSLQPGQTLFLRAGTYGARGTTWDFGSNGTASGTITVAGYPGDVRPVLLGAVRMTGQYIRLSGVILDGPTGDVAGPGPGGEAILLIMSGSHTEFSNSEVRYDYWHAGIGGDGGFDYRVIGNYVHDNGGYLGDYSDAQNNTSHGMYASPSAYGLIANNIFEHNDAKGWMARHDANHILVVNNTIVGNGRFGVDLAEQSHDIIAANNVVLNNGVMGKGGGGIQMAGTGPYWQINNVYYNNNGSDVIGGTITNPLIANPLLVRASDGRLTQQVVGDPGTDYHLLGASPAIGQADPNYAVPFDMVGKCRGSTPDAGAYQH